MNQPPAAELEVRPRTAGEILDDAGRLALADAPLLLALSGLFNVPAAVAFLFLLTLPPAEGTARLILPAAVAFLLPLTGLGSGACQVLFRCRAEAKPVTLRGCLNLVLRRGLDHVTARAMVWGLALFGSLVVVIPLAFLLSGLLALGGMFDPLTGLVVRLLLATFALVIVQGLAACAGGVAIHPLLSEGEHRCFAAWAAAVREAQRQAGKVTVTAGARPFLWMVGVVNLYLLIRIGLWSGDSLAGLDLALPSLVLTTTNPAYLTALALLVWLLLVPYFEAANYLLHADAQARYEGLDLWYRVRRLFPVRAKGRTAVGAVLLLTGVPVFAADGRLDAIRTARKELGKITTQIRTVRPYRGEDWLPRLQAIGERLDEHGARRAGRYRWFTQALAGFEQKKRDAALKVIAALNNRLARIEQELASPPDEPETLPSSSQRSKDDIRAVLPADGPESPNSHPRGASRREEPETRRPVRRDDAEPREPSRRQGTGTVGPRMAERDADGSIWMTIVGIAAAFLLLAVLLHRKRVAAQPAGTGQTAPDVLSLEALMDQAERHSGEGLWRHADELARTGRFRDAVRTLYLAVLALLHRAGMIRYAPTRTNGEYVRQLRSREDVCRPFRGLTGLFENKWYGERSCEPADYDRCRGLAEEVRQNATKVV